MHRLLNVKFYIYIFFFHKILLQYFKTLNIFFNFLDIYEASICFNYTKKYILKNNFFDHPLKNIYIFYFFYIIFVKNVLFYKEIAH